MSIRQSAPGGSYRPPHGYGPVSPGQPDPGSPPAPVAPRDPSDPPSRGSRRKSSSRRGLLLGLAAVVVVGLVVIGFAVYSFLGRTPAKSPAQSQAASHVASAPVGELTQASLDIVTSASALNLKAADLGADLYRVETPGNGSLVPQVDNSGGHLQLRLLPSGNNMGPGSVTVALNAKVAWGIKLTGGAGEETVDLREAKLTGLDIGGGGQKIEVGLPRPTGTITIAMSGGAGQLIIHAPKDVPARVRVGQGAGTVTVDGVKKTSVAPGTIVSSTGFDTAKDRIDLNASAGSSAITVDHG